MKKIVFLISFLFAWCVFWGAFAGDVYEACDSITDPDPDSLVVTCAAKGCAADTEALRCTYCDSGTYSDYGLGCVDCDSYWGYSERGLGPRKCYARCSEKDPGTPKANSTWRLTSTNIVNYPDECTWEVHCNTGYYRTSTSGGSHACNSCSTSLSKANYWTGGAGGKNGNTACVATCGSGSAKLVGVATYEKASVNYPNECIPKTCQNSDNYCSDNGSDPNGYHLVDKTCKPNWREAKSDDGDTGFQYWDTSKSTAGWSDPYIIECVPGHRHFKPQSGGLSTTPKCNKKYGTCESNTQTCNADFLEACQVDYYGATKNTLVAAYGSIFTTGAGKLYWIGDETTDKWQVSGGCKCKAENVPIKECDDSTKKCTEIGKKTVVLSYTGNGRKRTAWDNAVTTVTSCNAGYYANGDKTACIPVEDGYYSGDGEIGKHSCAEVEVCLRKEGHCSNPTTNYYKHSNSPRASADDCYAKCSERIADLNARNNNNGTWRLQSGAATTVTRKSGSLCQVELSCNTQYYRYADLDISVEKQQCKSCGGLTDSDSKTGYWDKSDGGTGDETSCYALCSEKKKDPDNGKFEVDGKDKVNYNAATKEKCKHKLKCKAGFYTNSDGETCGACPAGSTSNGAATAKTDCYMKGASDGTGTLFCDKHGCFNLPTGVQIFYAGD